MKNAKNSIIQLKSVCVSDEICGPNSSICVSYEICGPNSSIFIVLKEHIKIL